MAYCGFFLALLFVFFNGFIGGFYTDFLFPSRAMMLSLSAYPEMTFAFLGAYIVMCSERGAGSRGTLAGGKGGTGK